MRASALSKTVNKAPMLTEYQRHMLELASFRENGVAKGDIPHGYRHRQAGAWWRNLDQLEARGLVQRIGHRYIATPKGDLALSQNSK